MRKGDDGGAREQVRARGDEGVLEFRSLLGSAHGPVIDNPTLTYIPDPDN